MTPEEMAHAIWAEYLDKHAALSGPPRIERMPMADLVPLLYAMSMEYSSHHGKGPRVEKAVQEVDIALLHSAIAGDFSPLDSLSEQGLNDLRLRLKHATAVAGVRSLGNEASFPSPAGVSDDVRDMAALLYALAGPGRQAPD